MSKQIAMIVETQDLAKFRTKDSPDCIHAYSIFGSIGGARFDDIWIEMDPMHPMFQSDTLRRKVIACLDQQCLCGATPEGEEKVRAEIERFKEKLAILYGETSEGG